MRSRIEQALSEAPAKVAEFLSPILLADDFDATLSPAQFAELLTISGLEDDELRVALLPFAAAYSYAPISKFYVGAIVRGLTGRLYFGANVEILGAQLGQTVHAEQSAISHAWMKGEQGISDITINFSPCGHCRQFMNELTTADELVVQLPQRDEKTLQEYLPESFGPSDLGIKSGLMASIDHGKKCEESDEMVLKALDALNKSHAPYTHNLSGVSIKLKNGKVYQGAYAENAAFNPSLPPLQVALIQLLLDGESFDDIETTALVEMSEGTISHLADTQSTLEAINPDIPVAYLAI
ncbi:MULTISPECIES: cytidine deaminase [Vibrio]|jgi:cytidine deaminase|uniref:Cytidine deaminase n=1 Tax=Vibrio coralliilyticus TaxID=190893 RepID=A0AAP6ZRZ7_9VIBR|nr:MULTISPECIES: cytidine deaminase [Vibrio]AIW18668.1 cytidine deaminase [Vibrio coralliilyticus]AXN30295.1 cytidine deaminase [Vibrio coralliilyticus]KPH26688.1 cytidine deaminase [Vibrio coralliilyticus]MCC2524731.1 cytidine deaminase [Vibrio coralliilyticus]MCM5507459.1 cytidine deaminase [Vibrio sp. SCSIO 43169]